MPSSILATKKNTHTPSAQKSLLTDTKNSDNFQSLSCLSSGSLQVRYNLGGLKEPFTIDVDQRNLANGQPHSINMSRLDRSITIQVHTQQAVGNTFWCTQTSGKAQPVLAPCFAVTQRGVQRPVLFCAVRKLLVLCHC